MTDHMYNEQKNHKNRANRKKRQSKFQNKYYITFFCKYLDLSLELNNSHIKCNCFKCTFYLTKL